MSHNLKLTRRDAFDRIDDLMAMKSKESRHFDFSPVNLKVFGKSVLKSGVKYSRDNSLEFTEGLSDMRNTDGVCHVQIGTKGLMPDDTEYVDDEAFVKILWVICHESQHVKQCNDIFRQSDTSDVFAKQAIEVMAVHGNNIFYKNFHNYEHNTNEINAEYSGFTEAIRYLYGTFDNTSRTDIDDIVVNLVNKQCKRDYFLSSYGSDFHSVDEIMGAFEDAYINAFDHMQEYPIPGTPVFNRLFGDIDSPDCKNNDVLAKCLAGDEKLRTVFANASDRSEQLSIMASVTKRVYPSFGNSYKCLNDVDLSYEHLVEDKYAKIIQDKLPAKQSVKHNNRPLPDISDIRFDSSDEDDIGFQ